MLAGLVVCAIEVLSRCSLRFSYHMQRKPDGGPRDVVVRGDVAAIKPVKVIISAPFVP